LSFSGGENPVNRKKWSILLIFLFSVILITACHLLKKDSPSLTTIHLQEFSHSIYHAPQYVAVNKGFWAEEGLIIRIEQAKSNPQEIIEGLLTENTEILLIDGQLILPLLKSSARENIIGFAQITQNEGSFLVHREEKHDFQWEDLKKEIIISSPSETLSQALLEYVLRENKIRPYREVDVVENIPSKELAVGVFKRGSGNLIQLSEPLVSLVEQEKEGYVVTSLAGQIGNITNGVYVAPRDYLETKQEIIQKFTNGLYKAQIWCATHDAKEIAQVIKPFFPEVKMEILETAVNRYKDLEVWNTNPVIQKESVARLQEILTNVGKMGAEIFENDFIDNSFAQNAIENIPWPEESK